MRIAVDLRSLHTQGVSGVENYVENLTEHILRQDKRNEYTLFYNSFRPITPTDFHFVNSKVVATRYPNRILNLFFKTVGNPKLETLVGGFDCLFMPNFNSFAIRPETKLVLTVHDLSPVVLPQYYNFKQRLWHKFLNIKKTVKRADLIFAVSGHTKLDLIRLFGVSEEKIKIVYPGLDHGLFSEDLNANFLRSVRNKYSLPGSFILFLSTVEPRKNLSGLLRAFEGLKQPVCLVIAGKRGWKYHNIFKEIKNSPKAHLIKYLGYVDEADKPAIIKMAQAVVYPSFYEGFGFVPLEAMAVGVPALVSSVTSLPEVTQGGALMFNPYSIESITEALEEVLVNKKFRQTLVQQGLKVAKKFSWEHTAQQAIKYFNEI